MTWREASGPAPCPVCGGVQWCRVAADGGLTCCRRQAEHPTFGRGRERTDKGGGLYWVFVTGPRPPKGRPPARHHAEGAKNRASRVELDQVYRAFLKRLPVTARVERELDRRGVPDGSKLRRWYRELPLAGRARLAAELVEAGLEGLMCRTPGFFVKDGGRGPYWTVAGPVGIAIPVCDADGYIVGVLVRPDDPTGGKYVALSSAKKGGAKAARATHRPRAFPAEAATVRVTEGVIKADVATDLDPGTPCLGLPGLSSRDLLAAVAAVKATTVRLAPDADAPRNPHVAAAAQKLHRSLARGGFAVELETWPEADGKGIDDLLAAGKTPAVVTGAGVAETIESWVAAAKAAAAPAVVEGRPNESPDDPHRLARVFLEATARDGPPYLYRSWREEFWRYDGAAYARVPDGDVRADLAEVIRAEFVRVNLLELKAWAEGKIKSPTPPEVRKVTTQLLSNVVQAMRGMSHVPAAVDAPAWIECEPGPDPAAVLAMKNGLLDLTALAAGRADGLLPPDPLFFTTTAVPFDYDPAAPPPREWLAFLASVWPDDPESVACLQEWFGYFLTPDTRQQKILLFLGPRRSGKGTVARVLRELVGPANVAGPTLGGLTTNFGLSPLLGKSVAVVADARLGGRADAAVVTERLLSISGEDALTVDRKHREPLTVKLTARFAVLSNEMPRLGDASGALVGRLVVLRATRSFYGREDHGLFEKLKAELPGILLWAVEGWKRLAARGRFVQPASAADLVAAMEDLSSPVGAFVRVECRVGAGFRVGCEELYAAWRRWCDARGRKEPGTDETFGRDLRAAVNSVTRTRPRTPEGRMYVYTGIRLRAWDDDDEDIAGGPSAVPARSQQNAAENATNRGAVLAVRANSNTTHERNEDSGGSGAWENTDAMSGRCDHRDHPGPDAPSAPRRPRPTRKPGTDDLPARQWVFDRLKAGPVRESDILADPALPRSAALAALNGVGESFTDDGKNWWRLRPGVRP